MIDAAAIAQEIHKIIGRMHELRRPKVIPSEIALRSVVEDVFWSSVDQYEGNPLKARIYFAPKPVFEKPSTGIIRLTSPLPVSRETIRRLSPAHAADGALVVVEDSQNKVHIEAILGGFPAVRSPSPFWLGIESRGSGSLRVSIASRPILEFTRGTLKQLGGMSFDRTSAEVLLMSAMLFTDEPVGRSWHIASMVLDIGMGIERQGTGGALWILPSGASMDGDLEGLGHRVNMSSDWCEPFKEMWEERTSLIRLLNPPCNQGHEFLWQAAQEWDFLRQDAVIRSVSSLSKIDGAIVISGSPKVLAFGVICNKFSNPSTQVLRSIDPSHPTIGEVVGASEFGGSRHRSAIEFCSDNSPAAALVASHDGGLTVFASLKEKGSVIGSQVSLIDSEAKKTD